MRHFLLSSLLLCLCTINVSAQWIQRANFSGTPRAKAAGFTVDGKVYVLGGVTNTSMILSDFWEFDIANNSWTQKPAFPGEPRYGAASFVIGNKGYIATGGNDNGYLDDLWEYTPSTGTWIQRTGLPAGQPQHENQRTEAFAFAANGKGYLGGGEGFIFGPNQTWNYAFYDIWEYNPAANNWTQKTDCPDFTGRNLGIATSLNNKGYIGLGCDVGQTTTRQSFWEYEPLTDTWTSKASFPGLFTVDAGAFALDSMIYVTGGVKFAPVALSNQVYMYDAVNDVWNATTNFNGNAIAGHVAVSDNTTAIITGGYNGSIGTRNDTWEIAPFSTGIRELNSEVAIFPVPAVDHINVHASKRIQSFEVLDLSGKVLIAQSIDGNQINISLLTPAVYMLKVIFTDHSQAYSRFVKISLNEQAP